MLTSSTKAMKTAADNTVFNIWNTNCVNLSYIIWIYIHLKVWFDVTVWQQYYIVEYKYVVKGLNVQL